MSGGDLHVAEVTGGESGDRPRTDGGQIRTSRPQILSSPSASVCHPARVEEWAYDGMAYQINSMYLLPEDAWTYELTGPCGASGTVAGLAVVIPDRTSEAEQFTPSDASHALVAAASGLTPWPVLLRFIRFVETSGDILADALPTP